MTSLEVDGGRLSCNLETKPFEDSTRLELAKDAHTVLIPQPTEDSLDPLNRTKYKIHLVFFVIAACSFLLDYGGAAGLVVLLK